MFSHKDSKSNDDTKVILNELRESLNFYGLENIVLRYLGYFKDMPDELFQLTMPVLMLKQSAAEMLKVKNILQFYSWCYSFDPKVESIEEKTMRDVFNAASDSKKIETFKNLVDEKEHRWGVLEMYSSSIPCEARTALTMRLLSNESAHNVILKLIDDEYIQSLSIEAQNTLVTNFLGDNYYLLQNGFQYLTKENIEKIYHIVLTVDDSIFSMSNTMCNALSAIIKLMLYVNSDKREVLGERFLKVGGLFWGVGYIKKLHLFTDSQKRKIVDTFLEYYNHLSENGQYCRQNYLYDNIIEILKNCDVDLQKNIIRNIFNFVEKEPDPRDSYKVPLASGAINALNVAIKVVPEKLQKEIISRLFPLHTKSSHAFIAVADNSVLLSVQQKNALLDQLQKVVSGKEIQRDLGEEKGCGEVKANHLKFAMMESVLSFCPRDIQIKIVEFLMQKDNPWRFKSIQLKRLIAKLEVKLLSSKLFDLDHGLVPTLFQRIPFDWKEKIYKVLLALPKTKTYKIIPQLHKQLQFFAAVRAVLNHDKDLTQIVNEYAMPYTKREKGF